MTAPNTRRRRALGILGVFVMAMVGGACGSAVSLDVATGTYMARVPTEAQMAHDVAGVVPGGFQQLRDAGVDAVGVVVTDSGVVFTLDEVEVALRQIVERRVITDAEGSGPFKGRKEVLLLGPDALTLGPLTIEAPVVWPGGFEDSPTIIVTSFASTDRWPITCVGGDACLALWSGSRPEGVYVAATPDEVDNPIASIEVDGDSVSLSLDTGEQVAATVPQQDERRRTDACGLSESSLWEVPTAVGLSMDEPVVVYTTCPTNPGDPWLMIMDRRDIPVLAPLDDGLWCDPTEVGGTCLLFVPIPADEAGG